jgi:tetratricopeptide (TPR) repeat protein
VSPVDLEAELRTHLARKPDPPDAELARFAEPKLRRLIAQHRLKRGQFSRAMEDLEGFDRVLCELASAPRLQRFVSPGLFPVGVSEPDGLKGAPAFLQAALQRHFEGKQEAALEKLKAAVAAGAPSAQAALVRAHIDLWEVWPDPSSEAAKALLKSLRAELDQHGDLYLLPLRAIAAHLDGDAKAAWEAADRLLSAAPQAAETYLLRSILFQRDGKYDQAGDVLGDAEKLEPEEMDVGIHEMYLRWIEFLNDP